MNALCYFRAVVGDATFAAATHFGAIVRQSDYGDRIDYYAFSPTTSLSLPAGIYLASMETILNDASATALPNKDLPTSLTLGCWSEAIFRIWAANSATRFDDSGMIVTITSTEVAVPEIDPAAGSSALSLIAGVLAMVEQRRRRFFVAAQAC